jgi:hypothetical protein
MESCSFFGFAKDESSGPQVCYSLVIKDNLDISMYSKGIEVPLEKISHITGLGSVSRSSHVLNILSFIKAYSESALPRDDTLLHCITLLDSLMPNLDDDCSRKIAFIREQLTLATKSTCQRRYSALLLATAVMWDNVSPSLYCQMVAEDIMSLPGEK